MLQKTLTHAGLVFLATLACAQPARAQQTLNFTVGFFAPTGEDARVAGDIINADRTFLFFDVDDFGSATVGGEWLLPIGKYIEAGAGVSYSRQTVTSVYEEFVDSDGTEIVQDLRLRMTPIAFTVRVLPLGQSFPVQPYFGAGLALINWRYSETGEFVDFGAGREIFYDTFAASGTESGPVMLGGVRFAVGHVSAGGEFRYQKADAELNEDFPGSLCWPPGLQDQPCRIDLGGWTYNFTVGLRF